MKIAAVLPLLVLCVAGCRQPARETAPAKEAAVLPSPLPDSAFRVEWGRADVPKTMTLGRRESVVVSLKNVGDALWPDRPMGHPSGTGVGAVRLGYRWWRAGSPASPVADPRTSDRADLAAPLPPDTATTLTLSVEPPKSPGPYVLQLELVQEMVSWFEARGAATLKVPVEVKAAESVPETRAGVTAVLSGGPPATLPAPSPPTVRPAVALPDAGPSLRGLRALVAALAFIAIVPLAFGYIATRERDLAAGVESLAWTYVIGFAALVYALGAAATFFPARIHGPVWAAVSIVLLMSINSVRRRLLADLREGWRHLVIVLVIAAAGMGLLNLPSVTSGDTVFFDGHGNHDGFYNVGNASWLLDHSAREIPEWSVASPLYSSVLDLIGLHSVVTRLGAESLLAAAAASTGHDPLDIYLPLLSALLLPWLATGFLITRRAWPSRRFPTALWILVGALQPLFLFFFANGNFPNLVALMPSTLLLLLFRWQQTQEQPPFGLVPIALATAAPLATYPEVLAVTGMGVGILVLTSLGRLPLTRTLHAISAMAVGVALNPLVARRAWGGLHTALGADASIAGGTPWFTMLRPAQVVPAALTLSFHAAQALPTLLAVVVSLSIVVAIVVGWRGLEDRALGWAALAPAGAVCVLGWHRNMPYAYQKGVQWTALFLCALLAVGVMECLRPTWKGKGKRWLVSLMGRAAAGALCILWLAAASALETSSMLAIASVKRIDVAFRTVSEMVKHVPPGYPITVRDRPLGTDGFFAMWLPYFIRDHPLFFEWGEAPTNYLSVLVRHSARLPLIRPLYLLAPAGSPPLEGETPLLGNRRFWLFAVKRETPQLALAPVRKVPLSVDGLAVIAKVDNKPPSPDGTFTLAAASKDVLVEGVAWLVGLHACPREAYVGLADSEGSVVVLARADRFHRPSYVSHFDLPPDADCGFRARIGPGRLPPGTYEFRAFQLTPDHGYYTNAVGEPRLVITR